MYKFIGMLVMSSMMMLSTSIYAENLGDQLSEVASTARKLYNLPAIEISVRLASNKSVDVYQGSVGKDTSKTIDKDTLFQVGSVTKIYTSALILKLVEQHKLNLNDHLSKWFPKYTKWSQVTVLQLLNHTSGIYNYLDMPFWWIKLDLNRSKIWTADDLINSSYSYDLYFPSESGWHYSNADYVLLGVIVEKITGKSFKDALNDYVLNNKLDGIKNTFYVVDALSPVLKQRIAHGYQDGKRDMTSINLSWLQAGGALISNAHDLAYFYERIFSRQVISEKLLQKMTQFVSLNDGHINQGNNATGYGLGVFSMSTPYGVIWFTPGLTPGYKSLVAWLPCKGISFSYITNNVTSKKGFHSYMLGQILKILSTNKFEDNSDRNVSTKNICKNESVVKKIDFPKF